MIRQLIVNNVLHRPIRTIVSVVAVGVEVALVILIVGLTSGLLQETAKRIEGIGADIMLQPPSSSVFLAFSGAPMPIKIADKLREMKYVQAVAPVLAVAVADFVADDCNASSASAAALTPARSPLSVASSST